NLISNAIEAYTVSPADNPAKRMVRITIGQIEDAVTIAVNDKGTGVAKKDQATIFEPFYTTKARSGRGIGIGLVIVKEYVEDDFRGSIDLQSSRGSTTFTIR